MHVRQACLRLFGVLAAHARATLVPLLPSAVPLILNCMNESNAKVITHSSRPLSLMPSPIKLGLFRGYHHIFVSASLIDMTAV